MSRKIIHTLVLAALAGYSAWALAEDPPGVVGRISSVQGQVTLVGYDEPVAASLNWPVTAHNHIRTAVGARTEFRVGATAVRVDGDSDLEITDMDDGLLHMRLNYGTASIHVRDPEMLRDFELSTPQARVTMLEPGVVRVDVDRVVDTSQVRALAGSARVEGAGSSVVVNPGREVDVTSDDIRTGMASRDGFDAWAADRDRIDPVVAAPRFVSSGMTGYEELDRNGTWIQSEEYGPLWTPTVVAVDWAPYRDGRWIWLDPWGWTWVDNAPWGYAPSHYGRWVIVNRRWCWAPGRPVVRPVWAPALVGWVGGVAPVRNAGPGLGWYPLSPRERFVPTYRVSPDYERRVTWTHNGRPFTPLPPNANMRHEGLTMLPRDQFEGHRTVPVNRNPQFIPTANVVKTVAPVVAPPPPRGVENRRGWEDRDHDGRPDRFERNGQQNRVLSAPTQARPQYGNPPGQAAPQQQLQQQPAPQQRERFDRGNEDGNRRFRPQDEQRMQQQVQPQQQQRQFDQQRQAEQQREQQRQFEQQRQQRQFEQPRQVEQQREQQHQFEQQRQAEQQRQQQRQVDQQRQVEQQREQQRQFEQQRQAEQQREQQRQFEQQRQQQFQQQRQYTPSQPQQPQRENREPRHEDHRRDDGRDRNDRRQQQ